MATEQGFTSKGGGLFCWQEGRSIEDEIFLSVSDATVVQIVEYARSIHCDDLINQHLASVSQDNFSILACVSAFTPNTGTEQQRLAASQWIAAASKNK
ncbi:MAG: hypothetical protein ACKPE2_29640, partial [Dolichospermum sp.]